jgi:cobalt-zinc-cadmium resistance protein CzcA
LPCRLSIKMPKKPLNNIHHTVLAGAVQAPRFNAFAKATEMAADLRKAVLEFPEVSYVVAQLGRNDDGTDPWNPSHIEASVGLHPYNTWPAGETKRDLIQRMADRFHAMPGLDIGFSQPMIDVTMSFAPGAHAAKTPSGTL